MTAPSYSWCSSRKCITGANDVPPRPATSTERRAPAIGFLSRADMVVDLVVAQFVRLPRFGVLLATDQGVGVGVQRGNTTLSGSVGFPRAGARQNALGSVPFEQFLVVELVVLL